MVTRTSVESKITAINDGGNNTASEIRAVLTEMLNYTENIAPQSTLEPFRITNPNPFFSTIQSKLYLSIRGIKGEFANMTIIFKPATTEAATNLFSIPFDQTEGAFTQENFDLLAGKDGNGIIPLLDSGNYLMYSVPVLSVNRDTEQTCTLYVALVKDFNRMKNSLIVSIKSFNGSGDFSTSVSMHSQKFIENLEIIAGGKADHSIVGIKGENNTAGNISGKKIVINEKDKSFIKEIFGINN